MFKIIRHSFVFGIYFILLTYYAESSEPDNKVACEPPWEKLHRSCVWFVKDKSFSTWQAARDFCTKHNGELLCINDMAEKNNTETLMRNHVKSQDLMSWWVGLKLSTNGTWFWVDKEQLNRHLIGWDIGAGNTAGPDGLVLQNRCSTLFFRGYLKDEDCDIAKPFICERMKGDSQKEEMPEKQKTTASQSQNREISVKQATPRVNSQNRETLAKPTTTKADSQNKEDIRNWKIITTNSQNRETLAKQETATPNSQNRNIFEKQETMLAKQKTTTNKIQKRETLAQQKSTTSNSLTRELLAKQETTTKNSHNREISVMLKKTLAKHETTEDKAADYSLRSEMLAEQRTTTVRKPIEDGFVDKIEQLFHPLYQGYVHPTSLTTSTAKTTTALPPATKVSSTDTITKTGNSAVTISLASVLSVILGTDTIRILNTSMSKPPEKPSTAFTSVKTSNKNTIFFDLESTESTYYPTRKTTDEDLNSAIFRMTGKTTDKPMNRCTSKLTDTVTVKQSKNLTKKSTDQTTGKSAGIQVKEYVKAPAIITEGKATKSVSFSTVTPHTNTATTYSNIDSTTPGDSSIRYIFARTSTKRFLDLGRKSSAYHPTKRTTVQQLHSATVGDTKRAHDKQMKRLSDNLPDRLTNKYTSKLTGIETDKPPKYMTEMQTDQTASKSTGSIKCKKWYKSGVNFFIYK